MKKIIMFLTILVLVVFASGCTSNTSNNNSSNQSGNVTIKIISNTTWAGQYAYTDGHSIINGTGNATYNLGTNPGKVTVTVQNNATTSGTIAVQLLQGSNVVASQTNTSDHPVVSIDYKF